MTDPKDVAAKLRAQAEAESADALHEQARADALRALADELDPPAPPAAPPAAPQPAPAPSASPSPIDGLQRVCGEDEPFVMLVDGTVQYGVDNRWRAVALKAGAVQRASNDAMGGDPAVGTVKAVYAAAGVAKAGKADAPAPEPMPPTTSPVTPGPGGTDVRTKMQYVFGICMPHLAFGKTVPGRANFDFAVPTDEDLAHYWLEGARLLRLAYLWGRLQPTLCGDFDPTYAAIIADTIKRARAVGYLILLDCHSFGYHELVGAVNQGKVTSDDFADLQRRVATTFDIDATGLMNEPTGDHNWELSARTAIAAIRAVKPNLVISVGGANNSGPSDYYSPEFAGPNLLSAVHVYSDPANSGIPEVDEAGVTATTMVDRLRGWVDAARKDGRVPFVEEAGFLGTPLGLQEGLAMRAYCVAEKIPVCWWAAYPSQGWGGELYHLSLSPRPDGSDAPQMGVLREVGTGTLPVQTPPAASPADPVPGPPAAASPPAASPPATTPPAAQPVVAPIGKLPEYLADARLFHWLNIESANLSTSPVMQDIGTIGQPDYRPGLRGFDGYNYTSGDGDPRSSDFYMAWNGGHGGSGPMNDSSSGNESWNGVGRIRLEADAPQWELIVAPSLSRDRTPNSTGYYAAGTPAEAPAATHNYNTIHFIPSWNGLARHGATTTFGDSGYGGLDSAFFDAATGKVAPKGFMANPIFDIGRDGTGVRLKNDDVMYIEGSYSRRQIWRAATNQFEDAGFGNWRIAYNQSVRDTRRDRVITIMRPGQSDQPGCFWTDPAPPYVQHRLPLNFVDPKFSEVNPGWTSGDGDLAFAFYEDPTDPAEDYIVVCDWRQVMADGTLWKVSYENADANSLVAELLGAVNDTGIPIAAINRPYGRFWLAPRLSAIYYAANQTGAGNWIIPIGRASKAAAPITSPDPNPAPVPADPAPNPPTPAPSGRILSYVKSPDGSTTGVPFKDEDGHTYDFGAPNGAWDGDFALLRDGVIMRTPDTDGWPQYGGVFILTDGSNGHAKGVYTLNPGHSGGHWRFYDKAADLLVLYALGDPRIPLRQVINPRTGQVFGETQVAHDAAIAGDTLLLDGGTHGDEMLGITKSITIDAKDPNKPWEYNGNNYFDDHGKVELSNYFAVGPAPTKITLRNGRLIGVRVRPLLAGVWPESDDDNGLGIDLTLDRMYVAQHVNGLLAGKHMGSKSRISAINSWFTQCGISDGLSHNFYVSGLVKYVEFLRSRSDNTSGDGHLFKSRSQQIVIEDAELLQLLSQASMIVDAPHGGDVAIRRTVMHRGPNTDNRYFAIKHGEEAIVRLLDPSLKPTDYPRDAFELTDSLIVNEVDNSYADAFIQLALESSVAAWNATEANHSHPKWPLPVPKMGPVNVARNDFAGYQADKFVAQYPSNNALRLDQVEQYSNAKGLPSYRRKDSNVGAAYKAPATV